MVSCSLLHHHKVASENAKRANFVQVQINKKRNTLVFSNLPLVRFIYKQYYKNIIKTSKKTDKNQINDIKTLSLQKEMIYILMQTISYNL